MNSEIRVMAVDDEPDNLELLERTLGFDYEVSTFPSAEHALKALECAPFDVIISDHNMPGMTGVEFLGRVSNAAPETVRILVTGYADLSTAMDAVNKGRVSSFLQKPIDTDVLLQEVERSVSHQRMALENRALAQALAVQNNQLAEAKDLIEMTLDERTRELLATKSELETLASHDGLTGLVNYRSFQEQLQQMLQEAEKNDYPLGLVFCDVDKFKSFNDTYGHPVGDEVLQELSSVLRKGIRSATSIASQRAEDLVARYGGEEFVLTLPYATKEGARLVAERFRNAVASHSFGGKSVTMSFGVASFPEDATKQAQLIEYADQAALAAKRRGRNCVVAYGEHEGIVAAESNESAALVAASLATDKKLRRLERGLRREKAVRVEIETILEDKTRDLYLALEIAESRQVQLLEMETEKFATLGRLSAGIAHEFNNALNFVRGNLQHLGRYVERYDTAIEFARELLANSEKAETFEAKAKSLRLPRIQADTPKLLASMETGVNRATLIVKDMGVFARPYDPNDRKPTQLSGAIQTSITLAMNRLKQCKVHQDYGSDPRALCNADRVGQVFLNLIINAADATHDASGNGDGNIWITVDVHQEQVRVRIRDDGTGIDAEHQSHLFEPFYTTKDPGKGTGLGLFVCKQMIEEHDGTIFLESTLGEGTTFTVMLPKCVDRVLR